MILSVVLSIGGVLIGTFLIISMIPIFHPNRTKKVRGRLDKKDQISATIVRSSKTLLFSSDYNRWDRNSVEERILNLSDKVFTCSDPLPYLSKIHHNLLPLSHYMRVEELSDVILYGEGEINPETMNDFLVSARWVVGLKAIDDFNQSGGSDVRRNRF